MGHGRQAKEQEQPHYDAADPSLWFAVDCIHPNPREHHEIRALLWRVLFGA